MVSEPRNAEAKTSEELCARFLEIKDILTYGKIEAFSNIRTPLSEAEQRILRRELSERWVSEAEYKALEGENKKLQTDLHFKIRQCEQLQGIQERLNETIESHAKENEALEGMLEESEEKNREYAKLVAGQAEEYAERLSAIQQHYEKMPKENQSIYWTSTCDDEIQDEFIGQKFFPDLQKWYQVLGVLLNSEASDVQASLKEIGKGQSKKSRNVDKFLKELKENEKK